MASYEFLYLHNADIRRSARPFLEDKTADDFFQIDVRISLIYIFSYLLHASGLLEDKDE